MPEITLTYFDIQGVAEKVRLALVLGDIPFTDNRVKFDQWAAMKPTTPYGQLPIMSIDGGEPMAQSEAMLRYAGKLATENGVPLYPAESFLVIEEARGLVADLERDWRNPLSIGMYDPALFGHSSDIKGTPEHKAIIQAMRTKFISEELPKFMSFFTKRLLDKGSAFLCGDSPTIADCALIPVLNRFSSGQIDYVAADCLTTYPEITAYVARFMNLPKVKAWYAK